MCVSLHHGLHCKAHTHSGRRARVETAITKSSKERRLPYTRVPHQHYFEEPVWRRLSNLLLNKERSCFHEVRRIKKEQYCSWIVAFPIFWRHTVSLTMFSVPYIQCIGHCLHAYIYAGLLANRLTPRGCRSLSWLWLLLLLLLLQLGRWCPWVNITHNQVYVLLVVRVFLSFTILLQVGVSLTVTLEQLWEMVLFNGDNPLEVAATLWPAGWLMRAIG